MIEKDEFIKVTVRSFTYPFLPSYDFELGKPFGVFLRKQSTVGKFASKILGRNRDQVGIIAVNGKIALEDTILSEGDRVDLFALIAGG